MICTDLQKAHLEEACELFATSYRCQREGVPVLDEDNGSTERILPMLQWCLENHSGVAVFEKNKMMAYMTGFYIDGLLGVHKGVLSPEWAHASSNEKAFEVYRLMYQAIGQKWVDDGCLTHAIVFMSYAAEAQEAFCWNGFGGVCIDAIREVKPIEVKSPKEVRATLMEDKDIEELLPLVDGHSRHLAKSPAFKPYIEPESTVGLGDMLREPGNLVWMAWDSNEAVGYMKVAPIEDGAAWIVNGKGKFAVNGAYVKPEYRGKGIGKLLLSAIMEWATKEGFKRCSVDFEATNIEACRFWLRHFRPVCKSMVRRLDETILNTIR